MKAHAAEFSRSTGSTPSWFAAAPAASAPLRTPDRGGHRCAPRHRTLSGHLDHWHPAPTPASAAKPIASARTCWLACWRWWSATSATTSIKRNLGQPPGRARPDPPLDSRGANGEDTQTPPSSPDTNTSSTARSNRRPMDLRARRPDCEAPQACGHTCANSAEPDVPVSRAGLVFCYGPCLITIARGSVKNSLEYLPPSRPIPLHLLHRKAPAGHARRSS